MLEEEKAHQLAHFTIETAFDAVFWVDSKARVQWANEAACRSLGYEKEALLSMTVQDFNLELPLDIWPTFWERVKMERSFFIESNHAAKDGRVFPVDGTVNYISVGGKEYACCFVHDISERLRTEAEHREQKAMLDALFRASSDAIVFGDTERHLTLINQAALEMFGYAPEELLGKKTVVLYASPEEYERQGRIRYNLSAKEQRKPYEVQYRRKDGNLFWGETVASIFRDAEGNVLGYGGIIRDVTERKQAEAALRHAHTEIEQLKNRLEAENLYLQEEIKLEHNFDEIICQGEPLKQVLRLVEQVAVTDATVLILGESGTGKELLARAVHNVSNRSSRPLVKVNCTTLPENLVESDLFGHEKGAFTGALSRKIGRFELADGGTLFLDEIGELPLAVQAKLLRVLQEGEFERLGNPRTLIAPWKSTSIAWPTASAS